MPGKLARRIGRGLRLSLGVWWAVVAAAQVAAVETHLLVVSGIGGEPEYESAFTEQALAAAERARSSGLQVTALSGAAADAAGIEAAIDAIAARAARADTFVGLFIGHGAYDGETYRFNVPGPDPSAADLADWLARLRVKREVVVVATSASGAVLDILEREDRTLITATKSGEERVATVFGAYWVEALDSPGADLDKDDRISAQEAFEYAEDAVTRHFESRDRIATEHPRLVGRTPLVALARLEEPVLDRRPSPVQDGLTERLDALQNEIDALRASKDEMAVDVYYTRLQELLLRLAVVEKQIDDARSSAEAGGR